MLLAEEEERNTCSIFLGDRNRRRKRNKKSSLQQSPLQDEWRPLCFQQSQLREDGNGSKHHY